MDPFLQQFKTLPKELQEAVTSKEKLKILEEIEKKYNLKLAKLVVRIMIKDILWQDLENFLITDFKLASEKASELKKNLEEKFFHEVIGYLAKDLRLEVKDYSEDSGFKIKDLSFSQKPVITKTEKVSEPQKISEIQSLQGKQDLEEVVKNIKEKLNITFTDEILERRFENIVKSYFKDVRNEIQLEEALSRPKKIGGLELAREKIAEIIKVIKDFPPKAGPPLAEREEKKKEFEKIFETKPVFLEEKTEEESTTTEILKGEEKPSFVKTSEGRPSFATSDAKAMKVKKATEGKPIETDRNIPRPDVGAKPIETEKPKEIEKLVEKLKVDLSAEVSARVDEELKKRFEEGTIKPVFKKLEKPSFVKTSEGRPTLAKATEGEIHIQIRRPISGEKMVEDVSLKPQAIGPIEELAGIGLIDFRRWGAEKTCQIIFDKINLLDEESLFKKAEGIRAWQNSPLFKLYLEIGQEAMEKKKTLTEIIDERRIKGGQTLEMIDWEEISELNKKLRF